MKIAISATDGHLGATVDPRFGRCPFFLIVETDSLSFEVIRNPNTSLGGGAGIQSAQLMAERGVRHVLTGNCGPKAFQTLAAAGIEIIAGCSGLVRDAISRFKTGEYTSISQSTVPSHFGVQDPPGRDTAFSFGSGMGRGRGMGSGKGLGGYGGGSGGFRQPTQPGFNAPARTEAPDSALSNQSTSRSRPTVKIDLELCTGCGICVDVCPRGALYLENDKAHLKEEDCSGCGVCVRACPLEAITMA